MSWRLKRQLTYIVFFFAFLLLLVTYFYYSSQKPTCFDGKQNQGEEGIDCGGPCPISCEVKELLPVETEFLQAIFYPDQSMDLIGLVKNPNRDWALTEALAVFYLYDRFNRLQNKVTVGKIVILPREVRYVTSLNLSKPDYPLGKVELKIFSQLTGWQKVPFTKLPLSLVNERIERGLFLVELANPTENYFSDLELIVRFFDAEGNLIGLNRSKIALLNPFETITLSLTLPPVKEIEDFATSLHLLSL